MESSPAQLSRGALPDWGVGRKAQESELRPQLDQSAAGARDQPCDMAGASRENVEPRGVKMGLIQEIKDLRSQLHIESVAWFEELVRGEVEIVESGPRDRISCQVAIGSSRWL